MRAFFFLLLVILPSTVSAMPFIDITYASSEVPVATGGYNGGGGGGKSSQQYRSQQSSVIQEDPVTAEVPVYQYSSAPSASSLYSTTSSSPIQNPQLPTKSQQELDELTLEELEEYANEAAQNLEEQMQQLKEGFTVTGTSTLGSPLPTAQRSAILRTSVRTVAQLQLFAKALTESDEHLRKITVNNSSIEMTYRSKAYLFGFLPLSFLTTATASFDGSIEVDTPWWLLLTRDTVAQHAAALEEGLPALLRATQEAEDSEKFQLLSNLLKLMHDLLQ
ncbi:hypothetical protein H6770_04260 [Candidatus Peribacteria bacterium]|nr:hypothetical protein [Candidatus Peribacteria bacterium]